jgi:hypothetical protein
MSQLIVHTGLSLLNTLMAAARWAEVVPVGALKVIFPLLPIPKP